MPKNVICFTIYHLHQVKIMFEIAQGLAITENLLGNTDSDPNVGRSQRKADNLSFKLKSENSENSFL